MNSKKFFDLLGLAYISKKLTWGERSCIDKIKKKPAYLDLVYLIIISSDCGYSTKKKIKNCALAYNIFIISFGTKFELGRSIGKSMASVILITDSNIANKLRLISEVQV